MIVLNIGSGLGNVFQCWNGAYDFHIQYDVEIKFIWQKDFRNCLDFQRYFSGLEDMDIINTQSVYEMGLGMDMDVTFSSFKKVESKPFMGEVFSYARYYCFCTPENARQKNILIFSTPATMRFQNTVDTGDMFKHIRPSEYIQDQLDKYMNENGFDNPIGIHIRRTDNRKCKWNSPDSLFWDKIEELVQENPKVRIFLCTDDTKLKHEIIEKYPNNIFTREIRKRHDVGGLEDSVIDMFLLSKCKKLYGTQSTFAKVAGKIGQVPVEVLLRNDGSELI